MGISTIKNNSSILIIGHNDIIENGLWEYFRSCGYSNVFSAARLGLDPAIQPSVYDFFSKYHPEFVFLASTRSGGIEANQKFPAEFIYHNLESQNNIIYAAHKFGTKKLLYIGSSCVYPCVCTQPMKEELILTGALEKSSEPYAVSKIAGLKLCQAYRRQYSFPAISVVPATLYGPGNDVEIKTAHVMGSLIAKFAQAVSQNAAEVTIWGTGLPRREFLYRDDFIEACLFLMSEYNGEDPLNVGCGYDVSIQELAQIIADVSGFQGKITFDHSKPDGVLQKLLDSTRISKLGWRPKVPFKEGVQKTYQWYREQLEAPERPR